MLRKLLLATACGLALSAGAARAQSSPGWPYKYVPTAAEWNNAFAVKQDVLGYTPLNIAGGTMLGKLNLAPSQAAFAGLNLGQGVAPTTPQNGDAWLSTAGLFLRVNGVTYGPVVVPQVPTTWPTQQTFSNINVTGGVIGGVGTTVSANFQNGLLSASNPTFQGVLSVTNPINPYLYWASTSNSAGQKAWDMVVDSTGAFHFQKENDAGNAFTDVFSIGSAGQTLGQLTWFDGTTLTAGGWSFAATIFAPAGVMPVIAGGSATNASLTLEGTFNSPSGDVVNLKSGGSIVAAATNAGFVLPAFSSAGIVQNTSAGLLQSVATLTAARGGSGIANAFPFVTTQVSATVNFNSIADTSISVALPAGATGYLVNGVKIYNCTAAITTAQFGLFTAASGGGVALGTTTTGTITAAGPNAVNSAQNLAGLGTIWSNNATLFFHVSVAQGSAVTCAVDLSYAPVP